MKEVIDEAVRVLKDGGVILYPTDTVWGIGCDATNAEAVQRQGDVNAFTASICAKHTDAIHLVDIELFYGDGFINAGIGSKSGDHAFSFVLS